MDYQGNSNKDKQKQQIDVPKKTKNVDKVITGEVVTKPKPIGRRFKDIFVSADFKSVIRYVGAEVILPAARNLVVDASTKGIERMMYGETAVRHRTINQGPRITYNNPIHRPNDPRASARPAVGSGGRRRSQEDIILSSRAEAELVVERLNDIIDQFDVASVADLNDLLGFPTSHVDNKWGWSYLADANVRQIREGYLIDLPPAEPI